MEDLSIGLSRCQTSHSVRIKNQTVAIIHLATERPQLWIFVQTFLS